MTAAMRLAECRRHCSNAVTAILAAELAGTVAVNSVCPGWVKTDMGGAGATGDVAEGADIAVWLALDAPVTLTGKLARRGAIELCEQSFG
jgi:NAD(P)-dependent dehydrogenase (short-subunit alcohol dehydrogenase family)